MFYKKSTSWQQKGNNKRNKTKSLNKKIIELNTKTNQNIKLYKKTINITFSLKRAIKLLQLKQPQKDKQVYTT